MRMLMIWIMLATGFGAARVWGAPPPSRDEAAAALRRAVGFFRRDVSASGGYLWRYSADLARREGEGRATATTAWVQPPGTPTVGEALLAVFELTGDEYYREAARETALALVRGQLESGGWDYRIEFAAEARRRYRYRVDEDRPQARNVSTLDDDTTQSALRFLMRADRALQFQDGTIHEAAEYALRRLLAAQYPNGAWPQRFSGPPDAREFPVLPARYPETWPRRHPQLDYRSYYTFNDNTIADMIQTMFLAADVYDQPAYRAAAERAGGFILLAQMPEPQPAWAQQYDAQMQPAWARRFEPPAVTGGESQGVLRTLLDLFRQTGDEKYLAPVPRALDYLAASQLPGGGLARFYELRTNRPLYFTRQYELTYSDADLPTHYGFKVGSKLEAIRVEYERLRASGAPRPREPSAAARPRLTRSLANQAEALIRQLDERGAWVEPGRLRSFDDDAARVIESRTFANNIRTLARFVAASE